MARRLPLQETEIYPFWLSPDENIDDMLPYCDFLNFGNEL